MHTHGFVSIRMLHAMREPIVSCSCYHCTRKHDKTAQTVIRSVLRNDSCCCHPENTLLTAVGDKNENIWKFACVKNCTD